MDEPDRERLKPLWLTPWVTYLLKATLGATCYLIIGAWFGNVIVVAVMIAVVSVIMFTTYLILKACGAIRDVPDQLDDQAENQRPDF
jgi:hypothetical protein